MNRVVPENVAQIIRSGLLSAALGVCSIPLNAGGGDPGTVRIAGSTWVGDAPTKVADRLGLFNQDLAPGAPPIEVHNYDSGLEALGRLLDGEAEFALAAITPTALALIGEIGNGRPNREFVVLGSVALSNQSHILVADTARGIQGPADLAGRRVGVMFNTSSHYGWSRVSTFYGLDENGVELVDLPVSKMAPAMLAGDIDAAVIWSPWERGLRDALGEELLEVPLRMLYTVNWLLLADRSFIARHPDVTDRVLTSYLKAIDYMDAHPDHSLELHAEAVNLPVEELARRTEGMIWRLVMNWSVLVNMGVQFEWLATRPELAGIRIPEPQGYLFGAPLRRVAPERVILPPYLLMPDAGTSETP